MSESSRSISVHLPLAFIAMAFGVFFASQIGAAQRNTETMNWQKENGEKQLTQLKAAQVKVAEMLESEQRKELLGQSQKVTDKYTALFQELIELSKTDNDSLEVVKKWNIQVAKPAEPAPEAPKEP